MIVTKNHECAAIFLVILKGLVREMIVVDLLGSPLDSLSLFKVINQTARELSADYIAVMNNDLFGLKKLWRLGYIPYKFKNMVTRPLESRLDKKAKEFKSWSLMGAFHDTL
jgi:hypothetical protein